ncbi:RB-associated KRAB zinc finger protein-like [Malaya genurostris]|uniref:RB-associated KRAB zinc finger protein-like n=1 Tax=Malaya genurostris TaxID=325434 RepID=UPI0026F3C603|nr:RB-associated KRAB zinc finger protein-like [Malaya genurostris]
MDVDHKQNRKDSQSKNSLKDGNQITAMESAGRRCLMCLLPFEELGSIETESPEELKRIVENAYKIAKIEICPSGGKIEPLCGGCRAKLGYNFDEDAYYEMISKMYSDASPPSSYPTFMNNGNPVHIGMPPTESPDSPTGPLLDAACGTLVVTEFGRDESAEKSDLKCIVCSKVFNFKSTLRLHIRSHHNSNLRDPEPHKQPRKPRMYECNECNVSFKLKYDYDKHQSMHNRANLFQCEVCYKLFKHKSYYLMHRNAKRCKALPLNLSTGAVGRVSPNQHRQEVGTLGEGIKNTS